MAQAFQWDLGFRFQASLNARVSLELRAARMKTKHSKTVARVIVVAIVSTAVRPVVTVAARYFQTSWLWVGHPEPLTLTPSTPYNLSHFFDV